MKKILENQVPFPIDAESDNFTAALSSSLVITKGYTEDTPYWCVPNRRYCIHCSPCGDNLLERIAYALFYDEHAKLEGIIMDVLDNVTAESAMDTVGMVNAINGVLVEARWHAAEAFCGADNLLCNICTNKEIHNRLRDVFFARYTMEENDETHGIGWKIWGAIGVGPKTGYNITPQSADLILQKETQETLKCLFAKVFENDRTVCAEIQACLEQF